MERNAHGGWLNVVPLVDQYRCLGLPTSQGLQNPPFPKDEVVEVKKFDVALLSEKKKDTLKKQKLTLKKESLKRKIEEMDANKKQQKLAQKDFLKSKKVRKM